MKSTHLFNLIRDPMQKTNLLNSEKNEKDRLEWFMKAFLQQYNNRLIENRLIAE